MPSAATTLSVIAVGLALSAPESAVAGKGDVIPSGISPSCQDAYRAMLVCRDKMWLPERRPPSARNGTSNWTIP